MRQALLVRPHWCDSPTAISRDPRVIAAPVQCLEPCSVEESVASTVAQSDSPWLVFTSPASVQAFVRWTATQPNALVRDPWVRVATVGGGTRDELARAIQDHATDPQGAWALSIDKVICSASDERADAMALLAALDAEHHRAPFAWSAQTMLVIQATDNRPALSQGLRERGATVIDAALYRRLDIDWTADLWARIAQNPWSDSGVIVTSSTVIDRILTMMRAHQIRVEDIVWCTQHATIAQRLQAAGIAKVRRVRLDHEHLVSDLFDHEHHW